MWLSDYIDAIQKVIDICGNGVWSDVSTNLYGDFIFRSENLDWYLLVDHQTHRIVKLYKDSWRTGRKEVIYEGDV